MNPVDYETEEYQKEQDALEQNQTTASRRQGDGIEASGSKRKFSPGGEGGTKRAAPRQRIDPGVTAFLCYQAVGNCGLPVVRRRHTFASLACLLRSCSW